MAVRAITKKRTSTSINRMALLDSNESSNKDKSMEVIVPGEKYYLNNNQVP